MGRPEAEHKDIKDVVEHGRIWGYGNLIDCLRCAWAVSHFEKGNAKNLFDACLMAGMPRIKAKMWASAGIAELKKHCCL